MSTDNKYVDINKDLIDGCRNNDRISQLRIYELYYKAMYNTSYRIVTSDVEAEDIMQEAFLDAFRKIDTYQGTGSFGAWLKKIVINKSLDHLKKQRDIFSLDKPDELFEEPVEVEDSYAETVFTKLEEVSRAMDNLPENYRIILSLYLLEGYDQQEIAQILNLSHNNVRTRYLRAKQRLLSEVTHIKDDYLKTLNN